MSEIVAEIILLALITNAFKGLRLSNEVVINAIKDAPQATLIWRSSLVIGALLFVRWQMLWLPDAALAALSVIIVYETINAAALLFFRPGYLDFLRYITLEFSGALKLPVAAELLFFCYLFVKHIISAWGFLFY